MKQSEWDKFKGFSKLFFLWVNEHPDAQKFTFKLDNPSVHFTLRVWKAKKEIDLHRTDETIPVGDLSRYKTLFKISFFSLGRIAVTLKQLDVDGLLKAILKSKIAVGKLKRYKCILIPLDTEDQKYKDFYSEKKKKSGKKFKLNSNFDILNSLTTITPDEGLIHRAGCFMVFKSYHGAYRSNGFVYRFPGSKVHGPKTFLFFSPKIFKGLKKSFGLLFYNILSKIDFYNKEQVMKFIDQHSPQNWKNKTK